MSIAITIRVGFLIILVKDISNSFRVLFKKVGRRVVTIVVL